VELIRVCVRNRLVKRFLRSLIAAETVHPLTKEKLELRSPLPADMKAFVDANLA